MHTFFINTSKKSLNGYDVLLDIHYENKALVSMDCLMSDWYDKEKGYVACAKQMSDMLDGYVELNNAYNLIIYVDLSDSKVYSSIPRDAFHDKDREECCRAMHILFTHVISESIVEELVSSGRRPQSVLVLFGEEKKFIDFKVAANDPAKLAVMKHLFGFIGLPDSESVERFAKEVDDEEDRISAFRRKIEGAFESELVPGIRGRYTDALELWYDEVVNDADIPMANLALFNRISGINRTEADRTGIETVSCPYDCYACRVNKSALALSQLNIVLYLIRCVESGSIYDMSIGDKSILPFHGYTVDEIVPVLKEKAFLYSEKVNEIEALASSYSELKLAPKLSAFDHGKFGLDEYGDVAVNMMVTDTEYSHNEDSSEVESEEDSNKDEGRDSETVLIEGKTKKVKVVKKTGRTLFSREEFKPFDYNFDSNSDKMLKKNLTPEQYVEQASKLRRHHLDYLKKLKIHISETLSNYAGKSKENKPALLQVGGYRYAAPGEENKVLESVESVSSKAYDTIFTQYMEFNAGRSVAISDIEEQCNWFVSRVHQIRESITKLKFVAMGLFAAIFVLYLPYFIIQSDVIFNLNGLAVAVCSFGIPVGILYVVFTVLAAMRKKGYIKAWKEFKSKSDAALEENRVAVEKYDKMLSTVIPALRWVYEYKLDVDYCIECCNVADAKIEHHRRKLRNRIQAINNILGDLEYREDEEEIRYEKKKVEDLVDYNVPFCSGKKNKAFYSVIESTLYINKR